MDLVTTNDKTTKYAVLVKDLKKSYKISRKCYYTAFQGVNLHLPEGTIYGLLGPSGCGKTSLLKCILGRLDVTQGSIFVFGHPPGTKDSGIPGSTVGYMPQETTIFETMTIAECMQYYGAITGMSRGKVNLMIDYYVELLSLPSKDTINSRLSGGQLRRVAFAVAMIHSPKLLILDEPTVGIDCIIKQKMWDHLVKVVKETKASVILTTHYIEEARGADMVGLMHNNTLAEEDYTERLLAKYNCLSLEDVFLTICCGQSYGRDDVNCNKNATQVSVGMDMSDVWVRRESFKSITSDTKMDQNSVNEDSYRPCSGSTRNSGKWTTMCSELRVRCYILWALITKNFISLYRFPGALIFLMILPSFQILLPVYVAIGVVQPAYKFLVVNEDAGYLGSRYLSHLNPDIFLQIMGNSSSYGQGLIRHGEFVGVVHIQANFTESLMHRIMDSPFVTNESIDHSIIRIKLDNIHFISTCVTHFHIMDSFDKFFLELGTNISASTSSSAGSSVIVYEEAAMNYFAAFDPFYLISGTLILSAYFAPIGVAIFSLYVERNKGYLERTYVAGVSPAEIILGVMVLLLGLLVPQVILMLLTYSLLKTLSFGTWCVMFSILYGVGVSGTALGLFLAMAFENTTALVLGIGMAITLTTGITGHVWPFEAVPYFVRQLFLLLPYSYPSRAVTSTVLHGFNIYRTEMMGSFFVLLGNTVVFLVFTLLLFKFRK